MPKKTAKSAKTTKRTSTKVTSKKRTTSKNTNKNLTKGVSVERPTKRTPLQEYLHQRDHFFQTHPNAKWLLALLILVAGVWIYINIKSQTELLIAEELYKEGIIYEPKIWPSFNMEVKSKF